MPSFDKSHFPLGSGFRVEERPKPTMRGGTKQKRNQSSKTPKGLREEKSAWRRTECPQPAEQKTHWVPVHRLTGCVSVPGLQYAFLKGPSRDPACKRGNRIRLPSNQWDGTNRTSLVIPGCFTAVFLKPQHYQLPTLQLYVNTSNICDGVKGTGSGGFRCAMELGEMLLVN